MPQVVTEKSSAIGNVIVTAGKSAEMGSGATAIQTSILVIRCANFECNKLAISVSVRPGSRDGSGAWKVIGEPIFQGSIYPPNTGKPFPKGVPEAMLADYNEAWAILDLSPKSAATLARRCLQAMIRDFCGIRKRTLFEEIVALEKKLLADELPKGVEPETVSAMKVLKDKGNIGAHMTQIDGIIQDVDPDEARNLLGLIEMLFADWYVARHKRLERLAAIEAMAEPPQTQS